MEINPLIPQLMLIALATAGAISDIRTRRLPNWLSLAALLSGLAATYAAQGLPTMGLAAVHAVVALLVGMLLFRAGWIGGGDAKFYAGIAAWVPITEGLRLLVLTSSVGLVLTLGMLVLGRVSLRKTGDPAAKPAGSVPFGLAIAIGALWAILPTYSTLRL